MKPQLNGGAEAHRLALHQREIVLTRTRADYPPTNSGHRASDSESDAPRRSEPCPGGDGVTLIESIMGLVDPSDRS